MIRGHCLSYGDGITFWPLVEAVREAAGIEEEDDFAAARDKLAELLGEGTKRSSSGSASAVGLSERQFPLHEIYWGARKLVETPRADRPLVLVLEDLHWAEPALFDLVDARRRRPRRTHRRSSCASARPELLETRAALGGADHLALTPLSAAASAQIVDNFLGGAGSRPTRARASSRLPTATRSSSSSWSR